MADTTAREVWEELEMRVCGRDFWYWYTNYWRIPVPRVGMVKPEDRDYQHALSDFIWENERSIATKARQIGYTTVATARAFHSAFFFDHMPWLIVSTGEKAARKTLGRVDMGYSNLPEWMKRRGPARTTYSMESMEFGNGSRIDSLPSTSASGRGDAVYGVIFDEAAHMADAGAVFAALDPLCYGPMMVFSSANGMGNWFHSTWLDSQTSDSEWAPQFYPWSVVPGRDSNWYDARRRRYRGRDWMFFQEFPASAEEAFAKSGRVAFSSDIMSEQDWREPRARYEWMVYDKEWRALEVDEYSEIRLDVWEEPTVMRDHVGHVLQKPNYIIFCDTAEGLIDGDSNAVTVWDVNTRECVAVMETLLPIEEMGDLLEQLGYWYHTALIAVERNNMGLVPITKLRELRYPRLYRMKSIATQKSDRSVRYGWLTNNTTKPKMVHDFAKQLKDSTITLHDERFRVQAQTFVANGKGSYDASPGNHDDMIIAHIGAIQVMQEVHAYPIVWFDEEWGPATWHEVLNLKQPEPPHPLDIGIGQLEPKSTVHKSFQLPHSLDG